MTGVQGPSAAAAAFAAPGAAFAAPVAAVPLAVAVSAANTATLVAPAYMDRSASGLRLGEKEWRNLSYGWLRARIWAPLRNPRLTDDKVGAFQCYGVGIVPGMVSYTCLHMDFDQLGSAVGSCPVSDGSRSPAEHGVVQSRLMGGTKAACGSGRAHTSLGLQFHMDLYDGERRKQYENESLIISVSTSRARSKLMGVKRWRCAQFNVGVYGKV
eukprot:9409880-Pyramimonas_sp.AAC.1